MPEIVFLRPALLWLLVLVPALAFRLPRAGGSMRIRNFGSVLGRIASCAALVIAAAGPERLDEEQDLSVVVAVDRSLSLPTERRAALEVRAAELLRGLEGVPTLRVEGPDLEPRNGSDLAALLEMAGTLAPTARTREVLLLTDGAHTEATDPIDAAQHLGARGIRVFPIVPPQEAPNAALRGVDVPLAVKEAEPVIAVVALHHTTGGEVRITATSVARTARDADPDMTILATEVVEVAAGETTQTLRFPAPSSGTVLVTYSVEALGDAWPDDDTLGTWLDVRARDRTLVTGRNADAIADALRSTRRAARAVAWPPKLSRGDTLVVSGPELSSWTAADGERLARWVARDGGTLLLAGSPSGLGSKEPWWEEFERTLPVRFPDDDKPAPAPLALVYVLDRSDSMLRMRKMELATGAILQSIVGLHPSSLVGVLGFNDFPEWVSSLSPLGDGAGIRSAIAEVALQGGTDIYPALREAGLALRRTDAAYKHAILLTDGQGVSRLAQNASTVEMFSDAGITLSTVALSSEADVDELRAVAARTGGRAYLVRDESELPKILIDETLVLRQKNALEETHPVRCMPTSDICGATDWASAPPLSGFNQAEARTTANVLFVLDDDRTLLASWDYGLGSVAVFGSELGGGWSAAWGTSVGLDWLLRLLDDLETRHAPDELTLTLTPERDGARIDLRVLDRLGTPRSVPAVVAHVLSFGGEEDHPLAERAPGHYTAVVGWDGPLLVTVEVPPDAATPARTVATQASPPLPPDLTRPLQDEVLAGRIAEVTGGVLDPRVEDLLSGVGMRTVHTPLQALFLILGIVSLLVDVGIRRIPVGG